MPNVDMEKIYNEYFKVVYKYLICLTHSQEKAEDLVQETFCKAIIHIEELDISNPIAQYKNEPKLTNICII